MSGNESKLNMAAMKKAAKELGISLPKGDPSVAAETIRKHMRDNYEDKNLAVCGNCGYEAQEDMDPCPYCGTELGAPGETPKTKTPKTKTPKTKTPKKKTQKQKSPKTKNPKTKTPKDKGKTSPAKKKGAKNKDTEIVEPSPEEIAEVEARISRINEHKKNIAEEAFDIGVEIKEIHDKNLWKAKGHKSFSGFCEVELSYTRVMAYKYMAMAGFEREDAVLLGPSKADMIAQAPKGKKKKLMEMGKEGKSRKEMLDYLNKGKGGGGDVPPPENKVTLVGRIKAEEPIEVKWVGDKSGNETNRETKGKHAPFEIVTGVMCTVRELEDGSGLSFEFSKTDSE